MGVFAPVGTAANTFTSATEVQLPAVIAVLGSTLVQAQETETCHLCVNYPGSGGVTWHFWPDWGGGVCPDPEEENNCQMKPEGEAVGMPGYQGRCPTDGCPPHEEQEQIVAGALADQNVDLLVKLLIDEPDSYTLAPEGEAIQLRACNGTVLRSFTLTRAVAEELRFQLRSVPQTRDLRNSVR